MGLPSPLRAATGYLVLVYLVGGLFAASLVNEDPTGALVVGGATVTFGTVYVLQAALRLRRVLGEFASQVPGDPTPDQSRWNDQLLSWEDPPLSVEGSTAHRGLRLSRLTVEAGDHTIYRSPTRAREAARGALALLDRDPELDTWTERLPSPDPVHSAVRTAGLLALLLPGSFLFAGVGVGGATTGLALGGLGVVVTGLAGLFRWATLRRFRTGFRNLDEGLAAGGVRTRWINFEGCLLRPRYRLHTDAGVVTLEGVGHPWGRVTPALEGVEGARLPDLSDLGRDVADSLRGNPVREDLRDHPPLSVLERGAFLGIGAVTFALGTGTLAAGASDLAFATGMALSALAGVVCVVIGARGRILFGGPER